MIRTVLGDIDPALLGATNYHEHLFQVSPLLPGDELDDETLSHAEAELLRGSGFTAMIDATPFGLGRDPAALARISAATGLHVVATTGRHREAHYAADHPTRSADVEQLTALFVRDISVGMPADDGVPDPDTRVADPETWFADPENWVADPENWVADPENWVAEPVEAPLKNWVADPDTWVAEPVEAPPTAPRLAQTPTGEPVRAGILKGGVDYWRISDFERITLQALAAAHRRTGAAIMVHLEFCTAAHEVLDLLAADGVPPDRVVLAHADRDPDAGLHLSLTERGAYLGYDGVARPRTRSDAELLALTAEVVARGGADRVLLGGDVARRTRYIAYGGMPGLAYLGDRYVPRLRALVGDEAVERMLIRNPARILDLPR